MATITIPSPSAFLEPDPSASPPKVAVKKAPLKKHSVTPKRQRKATDQTESPVKPKQTKSRNGCHNCKNKRLKCDETKPSCEQCRKRNVKCEGYWKKFQWRSEEKHTYPTKSALLKSRKRAAALKPIHPPPGSPVASEGTTSSVGAALDAQDPFKQSTLPLDPQIAQQSLAFADSQFFNDSSGSPSHHGVEPTPSNEERLQCASPGPSILEGGFDHEVLPHSDETVSLNFHSGRAPDLEYLLLPGTDLSNPLPEFMDSWLPSTTDNSPCEDVAMVETLPAHERDESIGHQSDFREPLALTYPSPSPSSSDTSSNGSRYATFTSINFYTDSEFLLKRFDERTCGILSMKDGVNENPWRTMLWPMATQEPALYHAIISMTACHGMKEDPKLKAKGIEHQNMSAEFLRDGLQTMRTEVAIATTIVLGFSESWYSGVNSGIMHLRGARKLIQRRLGERQPIFSNAAELANWNFLCNTWAYMNIIARLTAIKEEDPDDLDSIVTATFGPAPPEQEMDPLMGCATSLFPLMGKVAKLVRQVRKRRKNSPMVVSEAASLRSQILKWRAPLLFIPPEDESIEVGHGLHTAEAYRWAILLYLYQAVPMICSENPAVLAERVLFEIAAVPVSSRAIILHIFPMFAAGCEAASEEDRTFVEERWTVMMKRMSLVSLDRCWDVIKEVWRRRDRAARQRFSSNPLALSNIAPCEMNITAKTENEGVHDLRHASIDDRRRSPTNPSSMFPKPEEARRKSMDSMVGIDHEYTVKGKLHWAAVMEERNWEILLG